MLYSGDEVYDDETTSGLISPLDRACEECDAPAGVECAKGCPSVWDPR